MRPPMAECRIVLQIAQQPCCRLRQKASRCYLYGHKISAGPEEETNILILLETGKGNAAMKTVDAHVCGLVFEEIQGEQRDKKRPLRYRATLTLQIPEIEEFLVVHLSESETTYLFEHSRDLAFRDGYYRRLTWKERRQDWRALLGELLKFLSRG